MPEILTLDCPFCKKGKIKVLHKPETFRYKRAHASSNVKVIPVRSPEKYEIVSEKCSNCGKSKKEIEKRLKEGKTPSREEIIRRVKEAGLPTKIVSKS